jgi:hypothetical protein
MIRWLVDLIKMERRVRAPVSAPPSAAPLVPEEIARRFCVDCRHRRLDPRSPRDRGYDGCFAPQNLKVDLVSGSTVRALKYCETLRSNEGKDPRYCGVEGRWFERAGTKTP